MRRGIFTSFAVEFFRGVKQLAFAQEGRDRKREPILGSLQYQCGLIQ
jgi:hypothetical protein